MWKENDLRMQNRGKIERVSAIPWLGKLFDFRRNITFMFFLRGISLIDVLQDEYLREVQKATWFEAIRAR